jgi:hypothetical protein
MSKLENAQKPYMRSVKRSKKNDYLNINIAKALAEKIQLNLDPYQDIYIDDKNNLVFSRD